MKLLDPSPGQTTLDIGSGPWLHSVEFAKRGFRVTGVDRTAFYLEQARQRAAGANMQVGAANVQVEWVHDDMRRFGREHAYAAARFMPLATTDRLRALGIPLPLGTRDL